MAVQKKRKQLLDATKEKSNTEIIIKPHSKRFKGAELSSFRGSRFRGISKNGSSWQILIMVHRKKKYLGMLQSEEQAAKFYDKAAI